MCICEHVHVCVCMCYCPEGHDQPFLTGLKSALLFPRYWSHRKHEATAV